MKNLAFTAFSIIAIAQSASATVSILFQGGNLRDSLGVGIADNSYVAIFADNDANSTLPTAQELFGQTLNEGQLYGGNELISLFQTNSTLTGAAGGFNNRESDILLDSGLQEGTQLAIYWFPNYTNATLTLAEGQQYGIFSTNTVGTNSGGNNALVLPPDTTNRTIAYFDENIAGSNSEAKTANFTANQTVTAIPEPSSTILLGLGTIGFALRRRR